MIKNTLFLMVLTVLFMTAVLAIPVFASEDVTLSISPASPSDAGEPIVFEATASGFTNPEYQFFFRRVSGSFIFRTPSPKNTYTQSVPAGFSGGEFELGVRVREAGGLWRAEAKKFHTINPVAPSVTLTVTPEGKSEMGKAVTLVATSKGISNPEFRFGRKYEGGSWAMSPIRSTATRTYTPSKLGNVQFGVQVREAGGAWLDYDIVDHRVTLDFNHNFAEEHDGMAGWHFIGNWDQADSWVYTDGESDKWSSAWYTLGEYGNFEFSVQMATMNRPTLAQFIIIRAGEQLGANNRNWYPCYMFGYGASSYRIFKRDAENSLYNFGPWTTTDAIRGGVQWNTLKVRAVDNRFDFFINNTLVKSVTDPDFTAGKVGFTMFGDQGRFFVARAILTELED